MTWQPFFLYVLKAVSHLYEFIHVFWHVMVQELGGGHPTVPRKSWATARVSTAIPVIRKTHLLTVANWSQLTAMLTFQMPARTLGVHNVVAILPAEKDSHHPSSPP
jgi:uncharacterized Fe-S cluster-containing radical SAM superfamily protein